MDIRTLVDNILEYNKGEERPYEIKLHIQPFCFWFYVYDNETFEDLIKIRANIGDVEEALNIVYEMLDDEHKAIKKYVKKETIEARIPYEHLSY